MRTGNHIHRKIISAEEITKQACRWRLLSKKIAFTNGVFDILHKGHISSLADAASYADFLIVGLNSDSSVKRLKGPERPINNEQERAYLLASLSMVDAVVIFDEDTPHNLICSILPDFLIKGGDYTVGQIAGAKEVIAQGGQVIISPIVDGYSTTSIINEIKK